MQGKTVLLGVTGGIAAYKAADIASRLKKSGAEVWVIMTEEATKFVAPLTFQTLSRHHVVVDTFEEQNPSVVSHIDLADRADLVVVAPATANMIAKLAYGIGDDMLSTTLLATQAPILIAPAMNVHMYQHWTVQENIQRLAAHGISFIEPAEGLLACGYEGQGKLAEPAAIMEQIARLFSRQEDFRGCRLLVTAASTREPLDPVRFFSNRSSGKMGYAVAEAAWQRGAEVTLISGPSSLPSPAGVKLIKVETAQEMYDEVLSFAPSMDVIVKAAAVADYRPVQVAQQKVKKVSGSLFVELERTPDILAAVGAQKLAHQVVVGFAAETENIETYAREKLRCKNLDLIVANDVSRSDAGFEVDTNQVSLYGPEGFELALPLLSKQEVAERILDVVRDLREKKGVK